MSRDRHCVAHNHNGTLPEPQDKELLLLEPTDNLKSEDEQCEKLSPKELMRARHPDLFSDTEVDASPILPKAVFEYHLDTLTSRKQEYEFEHFCRKLA
jgi:hypothetical protein